MIPLFSPTEDFGPTPTLLFIDDFAATEPIFFTDFPVPTLAFNTNT